MGLLGEMLVERGALSVEQLQTGLTAHREGDARLGTYLVDYGFIDERSLLEALAEQHDVPFITRATLLESLDKLDTGVMARPILKELGAIPFRKVGNRLQVAMCNPADTTAIDRIANFTQLQVEPLVASDRTIDLALEHVRDLGPVAVESADVDLLTEVVAERGSFEWDDLWESRINADRLLTMRSRPRATGKMLVATFPGLVPANSDQGRPRGAKLGNTDLMHHLGSATSAGAVGELLVHYAAQRLDRVCLFAVHHGKVSGWMGRGLPLDAPEPRSFSVLTEIPSVFWELEGSDRYLGPIPGGPVDDDVLRLLGPPQPDEVLIVALQIKGRAKGYVIGDIPGRKVPETVIDDMVSAAQAASEALAAILRGRK
jgi:hypothetical protein